MAVIVNKRDNPYGSTLMSGTEQGDSIVNSYSGISVIDAKGGNDTITNSYSYNGVSISGGAGNDYINNDHGGDTINAGLGDDTIIPYSGNIIQYASGDGNDVILNYTDYNIHLLNNTKISNVTSNGDDVILNIGSGSITLKDAKDKPIYMGDTVKSYSYVHYNTTGAFVYNGADTVKALISNTGTDNDDFLIKNSFYIGTINAGKGNDTIYTSGYYNIIQYAEGDGNDVIYYGDGFGTINITEGSVNGGYFDDDGDYILNIGKGVKAGSIRLKNIEDKSFNLKVKNADGNDTWTRFINGRKFNIVNINGTTFDGTDGDDYIYYGDYTKDYVRQIVSHQTVNGGKGDDYITNYDSSGPNDYNTLIGGEGNDTINARSSYNLIQPGSGDDSVYSWRSTVIGTSGNDTVNASESFVDYSASNGNNRFFVSGRTRSYLGSSTVISGKGNDYISASYKDLLIKYSAGNDTINLGYDSSNSSLQATSGKLSNPSINNGNLIIKVGANSLTFTNGVVSFNDKSDIVKLDNEWYFNEYNIDTKEYETTINTISATDEADFIFAKNIQSKYYSNLFPTLSAGAGNDTIYNNDFHGIIDAGSGNDSIYAHRYYHRSDYNDTSTIIGGIGNDTITLDKSEPYYSGENYGVVIQYAKNDGKDIVYGYDVEDTIKITSGIVDEISGSGSDAVIKLGDGSITLKDINNKIFNIQDSSGRISKYYYDGQHTVKAINNVDNDSRTVNGSDYADYIYNEVYNATINAGAGEDTIINQNGGSSINAGDDNDYINLQLNSWGTINGGKGDDTIVGNGIIQYADGDGNDLVSIRGGDDYDISLNLANGTSITGYNVNGSDHIFQIGTGSITFRTDGNNNSSPYFMVSGITNENGKDKYILYINGIAFNDLTDSDEYYIGTDENDYMDIYDYGDEEEIIFSGIVDGKGGDDFIQAQDISTATIKGGTGNDTIMNKNYGRITIDGGIGDDLIQNTGSEGYMYWSETEDEEEIGVEMQSTAIINGGDGNDIIENEAITYTMTDEVIRTNGTIENYTWESTRGKNLTIVGGKGDDTIRNVFLNKSDYISIYDNDDIDEYEDVTHQTVQAHFDSATNTRTIKNTWNSSDENGLYYVSTTTVEKLIYNRVIQYSEGDGNDVIEDYHSTDTLQIAGDYTTEVSGNDVIIRVGTGSIKLLNVKSKTIHINNVTLGGSGDGGDSTDPTDPTDPTTPSGLTDITLTNKDKSPYTAADTVGAIDASARTKAISITGNAYNNSITGGSKADTLTGGTGNDTLIGNAGNDKLDGGDGTDILQGGKGADTLTGGAGADTFLYTDGNGKDVITDYAAGEDIIKLTGGSLNKVSVKGSDVALVVGSGSIKVNGGKGKKITFTDSSGYTSSQTYGEKSISIANGDGQTINTSLNTVAVTLNASSRTEDLTLIGNAKANIIQLGSGNTTVSSGNGKDTIIANENGQVLITDYVAGQDKIKFNADITDAIESGSDIVFTLGTGKVTVAGGKGKKITVIDKDNKTQYIDVSTNVKLTNSDFADYKALNSAVSIDASKRTKAINIVGNASANSIIGGKGKDTINGGAGADTLTGGKGNDTLTGGNGADVFYYTSGDGSDVITDYSASDGDLIRLGKSTIIKKAAFSGSDLILSIGSGKITIKDGANQSVTVIDGNDLKATYEKFSKTFGFAERWFLEGDDNYSTAFTSDVSSILKSDNLITIGKTDNNSLDPSSLTLAPKVTSLTNNHSDLK